MKIDSRTPMLPAQQARGARGAAQARTDAARAQAAPAPAPSAPAAPAGMTPLERLAAFSTQLMDRVDQAAKDAPVEERGAIADVRTALEEGLARLHGGISGGTMKPEDIQRGVTNMFEMARTALEQVRQEAKADGEAEAEAEAKPLEEAVTTSGLAARLADLQAEMTATLFQGLGDDSPAARRGARDSATGVGSIYGALSGMQGLDGGAGSGLDVAV